MLSPDARLERRGDGVMAAFARHAAGLGDEAQEAPGVIAVQRRAPSGRYPTRFLGATALPGDIDVEDFGHALVRPR